MPEEYADLPIGSLVYIKNENEKLERRYAETVGYEKEPIYTVLHHKSYPIIEVRNIEPRSEKKKWLYKNDINNPRRWVSKDMTEYIVIPEGKSSKQLDIAMKDVRIDYLQMRVNEIRERTIRKTTKVK